MFIPDPESGYGGQSEAICITLAVLVLAPIFS